MNVILSTSEERLQELIKRSRKGSLYIALVSDVIRVNTIPKDYRVYMYNCLIPTPFIINKYIMDGMSEEYVENVKEHFLTPVSMYFLNEAIYHANAKDINIVFACGEDEKEFEYILLLGDIIDRVYGIKPVKIKKFLNGKTSKFSIEREEVHNLCEKIRDDLIGKLDDLGFELPPDMNIRFTKEDFKSLPKDAQRVIKEYRNYREDY